jgi:RHS repeat-associated protein
VEERNNTWNTPYLFNGKELDEETRLYYYGARYYNPRESVWLSIDPLSGYNPVFEVEHYIDGEHNGGVFNEKNLNVYGYCYQNPINYIDPDGKQIFISGASAIPYVGAVIRPTISIARPAAGSILRPNTTPIQPIIKLDFAKRDRVGYKNELEKAQDQLDGIKRAQNQNKKNAPDGDKQSKIQSIKKSEQSLDYRLKRIDIKNLDDLDIKIIVGNEEQQKAQQKTDGGLEAQRQKNEQPKPRPVKESVDWQAACSQNPNCA